jgi:hypothetical protein
MTQAMTSNNPVHKPALKILLFVFMLLTPFCKDYLLQTIGSLFLSPVLKLISPENRNGLYRERLYA